MTKFILHGGGEMQNFEEHDDFFREIINSIPDNGKVLLVYFAIAEDGIKERHPVYEEYFRKNSNGKNFELKIATKENFIMELQRADAVYFRGGDTEMLLSQIKKYPNFKEELFKKEIVAGSSAGANFLSGYALSSRRGKVYKGLGILPFKSSCHYDESKNEKLKILNKYPGELLLLREGEYKILEA